MSKTTNSKVRKDFWGDAYVEHMDEHGNVIGRSEVKTDFRGDEYVEHKDEYGRTVGHSEVKTDFFGDPYVRHTDVRQAEDDTKRTEAASGSDDGGLLTFELIGGLLLGLWNALPFLLPLIERLIGFMHAVPVWGLVMDLSWFAYVPFLGILLVLKLLFKKNIPGRAVRRTCWLWSLIGACSVIYFVKMCRASGRK